MSLMSHRTTCIRQEWTEEFSVTYLLVGSGNLLRYLFRNTYVTKSAFLLLCNSDDVCDRDLLGAFVSFHCMHACSWRYFYCQLHANKGTQHAIYDSRTESRIQPCRRTHHRRQITVRQSLRCLQISSQLGTARGSKKIC